MPNGNLTAEEVIPLLAAEQAIVRQEAMTVAATHPQWAPHVAGHLRKALAAGDQASVRALVAAFARDESVQAAVTEALAKANRDSSARSHRRRPAEGFSACVERCDRPGPDRFRSSHRPPGDRDGPSPQRQRVRAAALAIARDPVRPAELRGPRSRLGRPASPPRMSSRFCSTQLDLDRPPITRLAAAQCLAAAA